MNVNDLLKMVLENPYDITIEYSNKNGKEILRVNGKDVFDDSRVVEKIENQKALLNELDDCLFMEVVDLLKKENVDLCELNKFMDQTEFTEEDALIAENYIAIINEAMESVIINKMNKLSSLLERL